MGKQGKEKRLAKVSRFSSQKKAIL